MPPASLAVLLLRDRAAVDRLVRRWSRLVVRLSRCRVTVGGLEHAQTNAMFVSNHASYLDSILFLAALPLEFKFVAHHEAASWPLVGRALRKSGHIVVNRGSARSRHHCFLEMKAQLAAGGAVLVYPEGRRGGGDLLPFRSGAFRAAADTGCLVVPMAITGTSRLLPRGAMLLSRSQIAIQLLPSCKATDDGRQAAHELRDRTQALIAASLRSKSLTPGS